MGKKYKGLTAKQHIALGRLMKLYGALTIKLCVFVSKHYPQNSPQLRKLHRIDNVLSGLKSDLEDAAAKDGCWRDAHGPFLSVDWPADLNLLGIYYGNAADEIQDEAEGIMAPVVNP